MALFEQTALKTAEERFSEVAHELYKAARHEYTMSDKYGELTDSMRRWTLNLDDIALKFHLGRQFRKHFRQKRLMQLWEFVRLAHWMLTHYDSEEARLYMLLDVLTLLFFGTKENEEYGWRPFSRPLHEVFDDMVSREVERRVRQELNIRHWKRMQEGK